MPLLTLLVLAWLAQNPGQLPAVRARAQEPLQAGRAADAVTTLEAAAAAHPDSAEIQLDLADAHVAVATAMPAQGRDTVAFQQRLVTAERHYLRARTLAPALAPLVSLRLITLYDRPLLFRPRDAEPLVRALRASDPSKALHHVLLARTLYDQQRGTDAATVLVDATARIPADQQAFMLMTVADMVLQHPDESRADQRRVLESLVVLSDKVLARKGPDARDALQVKAGALLLLAERTARTDAERDSLTARGDATFDTFMALAQARSPEQDEADKHLAVQEAREAAMTKVTGAVAAQLKAGRRANAEKVIAAATAEYAKEPLFWRLLAAAWAGAGNTDAAVAALGRGADLEPNNPERHHELATYHWEATARGTSLTPAVRRQHAAAGLAAEEKALALNPEYAEALVYRGLLLKQQADLEPNAARKKSLLDAAEASRAKGMAVMDARQKGAA